MRVFTNSIPRRNALATLAAACALAAAPGAAAAPRQAGCEPGYRALGSPASAWAAIVERPTRAYRAPGRRPFARLATENVNRYPMVLGVLGIRRGCAGRWYRVQLPLRPNGVTGWVPAAAVSVEPVATRIAIDLSARRLLLYRRARRVLAAPVAVGAPATPTPTGRFYVDQRLVPSDAAGPYGPSALGVSAFSPVLTHWAQGGPIGIHGTNEPWSIGRSVSNGCIRVPNAVMRRLFAAVPAGTPVVIRR